MVDVSIPVVLEHALASWVEETNAWGVFFGDTDEVG
jgi:hypothetical protein